VATLLKSNIEASLGEYAKEFGLYLFAFFSLLSTSLSALTLGVVVISVMTDPKFWKNTTRTPLFWLFVISGVYLLVRTILAVHEFPPSAPLQYDNASSWFQLWLFLFMGWTVKDDLRKVQRILALCLAGLLTGMIIYTIKRPEVVFSGARTGFHLRVIAFSLYCSTAILGLILLAPRALRKKPSCEISLGKVIIWGVLLLSLGETFILGRSRGAWTSALIVIPVITFLKFKGSLRKNPLELRYRISFLALAVVILLFVVLAGSKSIKERVSAELPMIRAALKGEFDKIPTKGFGVRVQALRYGLSKIKERPLLGWGPGSTKYLISKSNNPHLLHPLAEGKYAWIDHLHNTYLEILFRFGLVGAVIFGLLIFWLLKPIILAINENSLPKDIALFVVGTFALIAIWSISDFRLLHHDWRNYWLLIAGIAYGLGAIREDGKDSC